MRRKHDLWGLAGACFGALALLGASSHPPPSPSPAPASKAAQIEKLLAGAPDHGGLLYELAIEQARAGRQNDAVRSLQRAVASGTDLDLEKEAAFQPLRALAPFRELERRLSLRVPARSSTVAFRINEPDLIPEGIAWDPVGGDFYLGSLHKKKIIRIGPDGRVSDFVPGGREGLWTVLGMKVDPKRRILWSNSAADGREGVAAGSSGLFAWDLATGRLLEKHVLDGLSGKHLFNDLAVTGGGDVFLTDTEAGSIYRLARGAKSLGTFLPRGSVLYANGISLDPSGRRLYVAHFPSGISIVDIATKKIRPLGHSPEVTLHSIDGLYFAESSLVAIQNGAGMERVAQFRLDEAGERVESLRVLESRNPLLDVPTTGAVAGRDFFYIANSQIENLRDADGTLTPGAKLREVLILRTRLG